MTIATHAGDKEWIISVVAILSAILIVVLFIAILLFFKCE